MHALKVTAAHNQNYFLHFSDLWGDLVFMTDINLYCPPADVDRRSVACMLII